MIAELSRLDYFEAMADRAWEMQLARADPSVAGGGSGLSLELMANILASLALCEREVRNEARHRRPA